MSFKAGVGSSRDRNPVRAAEEAVGAAMDRAGIDRCDLVMMFATVGYPQEALVRAVRKASGRAPLIGCSAEGVIARDLSDESSHGLVVMVWQSAAIQPRLAMARNLKTDARAAGRQIGRELAPTLEQGRALILLADGLSLNFDRFREGFMETARPPSFLPVIGGAAGDNWRFARTYQYLNDQVVSDGAVCALLDGDCELIYGVNHGCLPVGLQRTITHSRGNAIYQIDDKPVLEVFKEYLEPEEVENFDQSLANLAFGIRTGGELAREYDEFLVRFMPTKDQASGAVFVPTEVAPGTPIWMMRRDTDKMEAGVGQLAAELRERLAGRRPLLVFHFDCASRGKTMFSREEKQALLQRLQSAVDPTVPWLGFYTYGEIGPVLEQNYFHNYTVVVGCLTTNAADDGNARP